ncbi:MAG: WYL domain-containing protein [Oscillospiraceae bacterium]|nr:WYL domain-containing protein [Oscillospiraceae bacterium]
MARSANQKRKLPVLAKLLLQKSDEEHPIPISEMVEELERWGMTAERKSIYDDMAQLTELGLDVQHRGGRDGGWFVGERDFELAELKLLVDAVQSSRFLTQRKSAALIHKLEGLASVHQARQLQRQVYVDRRIKTMNESIFYNVDKLHAAIGANRVITFRYFEYNTKKERVFRHEGARYQATPFGLIWDNENYYLAAWDEKLGELRHYRVDKMADIVISSAVGTARGDWNPEGYAGRHFGMYSGRACPLRLRCRSHLAGVVIDRFGNDVMLVPDGEEHFTVTVDVVASPPLWGWLFGLGDGVEILSPQWAAEEFRDRLKQLLAVYE